MFEPLTPQNINLRENECSIEMKLSIYILVRKCEKDKKNHNQSTVSKTFLGKTFCPSHNNSSTSKQYRDYSCNIKTIVTFEHELSLVLEGMVPLSMNKIKNFWWKRMSQSHIITIGNKIKIEQSALLITGWEMPLLRRQLFKKKKKGAVFKKSSSNSKQFISGHKN